jgi:hypothetical protein
MGYSMATVDYIRVSTDKQTTDGQKASIFNYVNDHLKGGVDNWVEVRASTRKSAEKRKLDGKEQKITGYLAKGVNLANMARFYGYHGPR